MLRLNIQPSGAVTYPTLDDVTLNGTELGSCLKSAARLMVFPKFKGDTLHVEVPLSDLGVVAEGPNAATLEVIVVEPATRRRRVPSFWPERAEFGT